MSEYSLSSRAEADLAEIAARIARDNPVAAAGWLDEIEAAFGLLAANPMMGRARPELAGTLRLHPIGRYNIFYWPAADGVTIVRVLHSARASGRLI